MRPLLLQCIVMALFGQVVDVRQAVDERSLLSRWSLRRAETPAADIITDSTKVYGGRAEASRGAVPDYLAAGHTTLADDRLPLDEVPTAVASEIKSVDAEHRSIRANRPIAQWRFDAVRSRYEAILKKASGDSHVEEAIRIRLAQVTRDELAARAARTIDELLAQSHQRDQEVAVQKRRVAAATRSRARTFNAIGYMQSSTEEIDGRKLYVLIGKDGSTVAYLDIPPGLEIAHLVAHRVGVRGQPHYNEDLGSRLITVRDLEKIESRR